MHRPKHSDILASLYHSGLILLALSTSSLAQNKDSKLLALPDELGNTRRPQHLQLEKMLDDAPERKPAFANTLPDKISIQSKNAQLNYDTEKRQLHYKSDTGSIQLITNTGTELQAKDILVDLKNQSAHLQGPFTLYHGDSLSIAQSGSYHWENEDAEFENFRTKIDSIIVRAKSAKYRTDDEGQRYLELSDTYISTHDVEEPDTWLGFENMRIYPGSHATLTGLSIGTPGDEYTVPILGWLPLSHSLNPKEGYLPMPGSKSIWGAYLLNQYGFLLGDRRVEAGRPTSDYILTTHLDYRSRRGFGYGIDIESAQMVKRYPGLEGISLYYLDDTDPNINPTNLDRNAIDGQRYRIAAQTIWDLNDNKSPNQRQWRLKTNINILSDEYVLTDYFEEISEVNDKPDNTIAVTARGKDDESTFLLRFAPNDYYIADERTEYSYYRVRQPIFGSSINYETRNSIGYMRQVLPTADRIAYETALASVTDETVANYYKRMLNTSGYARVSSIHEFTSSFKVLDFLNLTPKAGFTYNGYYNVEDVGNENRVGGFLSCDLDFKLHRKFKNIKSSLMGIDGVTHTIHPYATLSHNSISSSDPLIPQINSWANYLAGSPNNPMPLDLCGFVGPDGLSRWTILRPGIQNILRTTYDKETRTLLQWNIFMDLNLDNEIANDQFSNLYSYLSLYPTKRLKFVSEIQFPFLGEGDDFTESSNTLYYQTSDWVEVGLGHRYINQHAVIEDANLVSTQLNIRFNENYTFAGRWYFDLELNETPIQQYSLFRNVGAWHVGATLFLRNNGGKQETGFGISFTLRETGTSLPVDFF